MKRGDVVTAVLHREQGKPRPAIVVQADELTYSSTVLLCPLTSDLAFQAPHRPELAPSPENGLRTLSLVMADKLQTTLRTRCGGIIGELSESEMSSVEASMAFALGMRRT